MTTELSDYEKERLANIARNQKVLESLGLVRRDAELHESIRSKEAPKKKRKIDPESADAVRAAVRRSARDSPELRPPARASCRPALATPARPASLAVPTTVRRRYLNLSSPNQAALRQVASGSSPPM